MKLRLRGVLTWQILVELKDIWVFIPLPQVCVFVKIGHAWWWSCSNCFMFCNTEPLTWFFPALFSSSWKQNTSTDFERVIILYIPMTYSGQRPARTIKAEENWREESSKRIGRPIFWPKKKKMPLMSFLSMAVGVCTCTDGRSLPLSAVAMAMAEKRSLVGEAP